MRAPPHIFRTASPPRMVTLATTGNVRNALRESSAVARVRVKHAAVALCAAQSSVAGRGWVLGSRAGVCHARSLAEPGVADAVSFDALTRGLTRHWTALAGSGTTPLAPRRNSVVTTCEGGAVCQVAGDSVGGAGNRQPLISVRQLPISRAFMPGTQATTILTRHAADNHGPTHTSVAATAVAPRVVQCCH